MTVSFKIVIRSTGNLLSKAKMTTILPNFQNLTNFWVTLEGHLGVKRVINSLSPRNVFQKLKICTGMLFHMKNLIVASVFFFQNLAHFGSNFGVTSVRNGRKLHIYPEKGIIFEILCQNF